MGLLLCLPIPFIAQRHAGAKWLALAAVAFAAALREGHVPDKKVVWFFRASSFSVGIGLIRVRPFIV